MTDRTVPTCYTGSLEDLLEATPGRRVTARFKNLIENIEITVTGFVDTWPTAPWSVRIVDSQGVGWTLIAAWRYTKPNPTPVPNPCLIEILGIDE